MYSDKKNILQLVALLIEHGVSNIVLWSGKPELSDCAHIGKPLVLQLPFHDG